MSFYRMIISFCLWLRFADIWYLTHLHRAYFTNFYSTLLSICMHRHHHHHHHHLPPTNVIVQFPGYLHHHAPCHTINATKSNKKQTACTIPSQNDASPHASPPSVPNLLISMKHPVLRIAQSGLLKWPNAWDCDLRKIRLCDRRGRRMLRLRWEGRGW